jgi:hypothetical protein
MYDYKYRQVEPSYRKRKRRLFLPMALVFVTALALGLALIYLPGWIQGLSGNNGDMNQDLNRNVIPLTLPPRPVDSSPK